VGATVWDVAQYTSHWGIENRSHWRRDVTDGAKITLRFALAALPKSCVQIALVWKSTEMPAEAKRKQDLDLFREELADVLDWQATRSTFNEVLIHI
jgi:hypothetical protein